MKNNIIRINDISDIDTSRISVYDLNNRYIDAHGNWYGTRYNRKTKKIEIIKLVRASAGEVQQLKSEIGRNRAAAGAVRSSKPETVEIYDNIITEDKYDDPENDDFSPEQFISESVSRLLNYKSRITAMLSGVKNSNFLQKENKADSIEFNDLSRTIEIDVLQEIDKLESYHKELVNYPRSPNYYIGKLDKKGKEIYDSLTGADDGKVISFIFRFEMYNALKEISETVREILIRFKDFIEERNPDDATSLPQTERQMIKDSIISSNNTLNEIENILDHLEKLKQYVYNIDYI